MPSKHLIFAIGFLSLSLAVSVQAQNAPPNIPASLNDATTFDEARAYLSYNLDIINQRRLPDNEDAAAKAELGMAASEKMLKFAETTGNKLWAYMIRHGAHNNQIRAGIEGAVQQMEDFLNELDANEEIEEQHVEAFRLSYLMTLEEVKGSEEAKQKIEAYRKEFEAREDSVFGTQMLQSIQWHRHRMRMQEARQLQAAAENFARFQTELKSRIDQAPEFFGEIVRLGFETAHKHNFSVEQFVKELSEFIQSPQCGLSAEKKEELLAELEAMARLIPGIDPKLYGRTLDGEEFKWESLREKDNEKYVLIKFTATWCVPCRAMIPDLLEAYQKYHDKGLEIISVYIEERSSNPVAAVRRHVEEARIPWIILSEALTVRAGQPAHGEHYGIQGVPTIVLVGKDAKIILPAFRGSEWKAKLAEIFE